MKKAYVKARCADCTWKDLIDKEGGRTMLSWFCPKGGIYMVASQSSLRARRKCTAFKPKVKITPSLRSCRDWRKTIQEKYGNFLQVAAQGERRCSNGRRWNGHAVLVVVDAALDSIGLNYFKIVVPRVRAFYRDYVKTGQIHSVESLSELTPKDSRLKDIMNNERVWKVAIEICRELLCVRAKRGLKTDFDALKFWAERANYENWKEDPIGKIAGVGLITFQYLRMQAGVDTTMPDKVIRRVVEQDFGIGAENNIQFIKKMENLSEKTGYSQTLICWAIWLKEAGVDTSNWEKLNR